MSTYVMYNEYHHPNVFCEFDSKQIINIEINQEIILVDNEILLPVSMQCKIHFFLISFDIF